MNNRQAGQKAAALIVEQLNLQIENICDNCFSVLIKY